MGKDDHYVFMDGCIVKGCRPYVVFEATFGEYAMLLKDLYGRGGWGKTGRRLLGVPVPGQRRFADWVAGHVHTAQSTQNLRTGASRLDEILRSIHGNGRIHLFGTSAAGAAMLEYFLLCDPATLYKHEEDRRNRMRPAKRFDLDTRIASLTTIDAPANWVPLRRDSHWQRYFGRDSLGFYLASHTRVKAGPGIPTGGHTTRMEDVPGTWVGSDPVAGIDYDNHPHFSYLPRDPVPRHMYTGSHMSAETRDYLERVWG